MIDPLLSHRRDLVNALCQHASKTQGGPWSIVNICEGDESTVIEFETDYPVRNWATESVAPQQIRRMKVEVWPIKEPQ